MPASRSSGDRSSCLPCLPLPTHYRIGLSAKPFELWKLGTLSEELGLPNPEHARVEIIGGKLVMPPASEYYDVPDLDEVEGALVQRNRP